MNEFVFEDVFGVKQEQVKAEEPQLDLSLLGTVRQNAAAIFNAANSAVFDVVEKLGRGEAVSYADIFKADRGLNVFGELYPDIPEFHQPLDQKTAEILLKKYISVAKSLNTAAKRIDKLNDTFAKKMQKRVKALTRMHKGFKKVREQFIQTIRVEDLTPFDGGEFNNQLIFGRKATIVINYTASFPIENPVSSEQDLLHAQLSNIIDHSEAFKMATSGKVRRQLELSLHSNGHRLTYRVKDGTLTQYTGPSTEQDTVITVSLSYAIDVPKSNLNTVLDVLESVRFPVYRAEFYDLLSTES